MQIEEIKNNMYKVEPIKMKNDGLIKHVHAPLADNYGFFTILCGRPNAGKTSLLLNMLIKKSKNTYYKKFDEVYIFSNSLDTITEKIKLDPSRMFNGISELEAVIENVRVSKDKKRILFVLDDCVNDIKSSDDYMLKLIYNRRHISGSISIIITTQVYNKIALTIRKCANDIFLFSTSNKKELNSLFQDFINIPEKDFYKICRYCFAKDNHQFIVIRTSDNTFYHNFNQILF
jgi:hypothetical protein